MSWVLRNADPEVARLLAAESEGPLRHTLGLLVGSPLQDTAWTLAGLPVRLGGLGVANPVDFWEGANFASWLTAASADPGFFSQGPSVVLTCSMLSLAGNFPSLGGALTGLGLPWAWDRALAHQLFPKWCSQRAWSQEMWERKLSLLNATAPARDRLLRLLQASPNAGAWLTEAPGEEAALSFSTPEWQTLLRFRLGQSLYPAGSLCDKCGTVQDVTGDHALSCHSCGIYFRHNGVRDGVAHLCREAGWAPELEVCLPGSQERPADVLLHRQGITPLALDLTVTHPLRPSASLATVSVPGVEAEKLEKAKAAQSMGPCKDAGWRFAPLGMETTGGLGPHCRRFFRQLTRQLCLRTGGRPWDTARHVSHCVSAALARGRAHMLLAAGANSTYTPDVVAGTMQGAVTRNHPGMTGMHCPLERASLPSAVPVMSGCCTFSSLQRLPDGHMPLDGQLHQGLVPLPTPLSADLRLLPVADHRDEPSSSNSNNPFALLSSATGVDQPFPGPGYEDVASHGHAPGGTADPMPLDDATAPNLERTAPGSPATRLGLVAATVDFCMNLDSQTEGLTHPLIDNPHSHSLFTPRPAVRLTGAPGVRLK